MDHPRVCGEKWQLKPRVLQYPGSPPRMRGKAFSVSQAHNDGGITPAYAGKRARPHYHMILYGDHPRVCGEKAAILCKLKLSPGSPPRMRGKEANRCMQPPKCGITPAYAGKSRLQGTFPARQRDHPRVCGEKPTRPAGRVPGLGSPPRMRGKGGRTAGPRHRTGITPAYAGKRIAR